MTQQKPRVVVLGSGYAGILTVARLQKLLRKEEAEILLVNKHDYHYLTTWLHEVAAGTCDENRITIPIGSVIDTDRVNFIKDTVVEVQKENQRVLLAHGEALSYDYLVVALGYEPATFGIPGILEHSLTIRSMNSARDIRSKIESRFADFAKNHKGSQEKLTFLVGGAGFTGIEFVAELAERFPLLCEEHGIDPKQVQIINVEGAPRILANFDPSLADYAKASLERMGVQFRLSTRIKAVDPDGVTLLSEQGEERIAPATVIWTGGIQGNTVVCDSAFEASYGRIPAEEDLRVKAYENVFVIGDCSSFVDKRTGRPYPPTAQIAILQSQTCANNIVNLLRGGKKLEAFEPFLKGAVASLGKHDAVGVVFGVKVRGKLAVMMKSLIDLRYLYILGGIKLILAKSSTSCALQTAYSQSDSK
ncbi:NAD(P)/FAD-dependent oxidoreductase [Heliorestis acidaminivorans]|uniref:NAD(P)/FAD-dependent oxidoreductase n=1 Tax=Heliorestis acidaminivorans TaxID=553427 RepID=A0A6I0F3X2_9FIRM|nr:NAD(P)/FAD-dependent oxidoreductase [Heliorestis acidaminivorans]KAB2953427.1 NAD(P)/FAD-dependent oxidoreductase [Heliorestis acidaminivorans]